MSVVSGLNKSESTVMVVEGNINLALETSNKMKVTGALGYSPTSFQLEGAKDM